MNAFAPDLSLWRFRSFAELAQVADPWWSLHAYARDIENAIPPGSTVAGYSVTAERFVEFGVHWPSNGRRPHWRETLLCPVTGLNNRVRAAYHAVVSDVRNRSADIYLTEQTGQFYKLMKARFPGVVGSEYLGLAPGALSPEGIRSEDLTRLSFDGASFDAVVSLEVLEHVPDYQSALGECCRVLRPGGKLFLTAPFRFDVAQTIVRARVVDGKIVHLLPPEYHGDPIGTGGILSYFHFGWSLLDDLRAAGFADAYAGLYWSIELGHLGFAQTLIVASK